MEDSLEYGDVAHPGTDPVAPGGGEAQVVAEALLGVAVDARVNIGPPHGQALEDLGQHEHSGPGDEPPDNERPGRRRGTHLFWEAEYPSADHRADDERNEYGQGHLRG